MSRAPEFPVQPRRRTRSASRSPASVTPRLVADALERWFADHARDLPWRRPDIRGGYAALISESMLQQTQVARVVDAFNAFMLRFPTVEALAAADEQAVLAAWTGLGYYRRARNLHRAARTLVESHGGAVPSDVDSLRRLPGVGRYTAGAIASIAFGVRAPIVDGNVVRVLLRLHGRALASDDPAAQRWAWEEAQELVDAAQSPARLNEGLMELGAIVCTPRNPTCDACPLWECCAARQAATVASIPAPRRASARRVVHHHAIVVRRGDRLLLEQRGDNGLWAAMWQVPTVECPTRLPTAALCRHLDARGLRLADVTPRGRFVHLTTHREVHFEIHTATTRCRRGSWHAPDEALRRPLSSPMRRILRLVIDSTAPAHAANAAVE